MKGFGAKLHKIGFFGYGNLTNIVLVVKKFSLRMNLFLVDGSVLKILNVVTYALAMEGNHFDSV